MIDDNPENEHLKKVQGIVHQSIDDLGKMISTISVKQIEDHSLSYAIEKLFEFIPESINITTSLEFKEDSISPSIKAHIFRVIQEAINNTNKYSQARNLKVEIQHDNHMLDLLIEDDGEGFDLENDSTGNGLKNMVHRIRRSNGLVNISSKKGSGTKILAKLPCN